VRARRTQTHIESTSSLAMKLTWPRIETPTHYILVGFDEDLNKAFVNAVAETVDFLVAHKGLERSEAYSQWRQTAASASSSTCARACTAWRPRASSSRRRAELNDQRPTS
jgi:hypothetical protein